MDGLSNVIPEVLSIRCVDGLSNVSPFFRVFNAFGQYVHSRVDLPSL